MATQRATHTRRSEGVLPAQHLDQAIAEGIVDAGRFSIPQANIQPASLDLRLGERAVRLRCSFLPGDDAVADKLGHYALDELDLGGRGAVLETGRPYLVELKERLALPAQMHGKANPKSSTGRVDVFTRIITDGGRRFDEIAPGYRGGLYLEVVPLSFPVRVREGLALNQLRLAVGRPRLSDAEILVAHEHHPLLRQDGQPVAQGSLLVADGLFLGLDLRGADETGRVGYCARHSAPLLDLGASEPVDPELFWEPVCREPGDRLVLAPHRFYLLMSRETVCIPPSLAAEMTAYDPTSGELRTHYAGFFDPGFGFDPEGSHHGSRAALEVRAHDVPFMIEDGQPVCKLTFEHMLEEPRTLYGQGIGSSYQGQRETLGKWFDGAHRPVGTHSRTAASS
ncbi:MAG: 2'-deoxycytidine 5'-triphosphate deaminase [Actinomycetota bacterium]|nr:2'-deoxycytidine 5'-triphosphate deaminase [Actinomycetota bacterium]